jgi:hypothetical protein
MPQSHSVCRSKHDPEQKYIVTMSAQCEIVELRFPTDAVGYACTRSATQHCDDCGTSLCSTHSEKCHRCRLIFCSGCMPFHVGQIHGKPTTGVRIHHLNNGSLKVGWHAAAHSRLKPFISRSIQSARTAITPLRPLNVTIATLSIYAAQKCQAQFVPKAAGKPIRTG